MLRHMKLLKMKQNSEPQKLTDVSYWEKYWSNKSNLDIIDIDALLYFKWMRGYLFKRMHEIFSSLLPKDNSKLFLEIGCAPGRWIIYFFKHFGYRCFGIESSEIGFKKTLQTLKIANIDAEIIKEDLFAYINSNRKIQFDIVFSAGFLEHFSDVTMVIEKVSSLVKPGGILISTVPNLTGLHKFFINLSSKKEHIYKYHFPINIKKILKAYKDQQFETKVFTIGSIIPRFVGSPLITKPLNILLLGMKFFKLNFLLEGINISNTYLTIGIKKTKNDNQ